MAQSSLQQMLGSTEALYILLALGVILCIICRFLHSFSLLFVNLRDLCGVDSFYPPMYVLTRRFCQHRSFHPAMDGQTRG